MWEEMALHRILPRLPSKSLMRFKCVRKSWYTVINNPMFVESHLSNSMHNKLYPCVLFSRFNHANTDEKELGFSFLHHCKDHDDAEHNVNFVVEDTKFPLPTGRFPGFKVTESTYIAAHCDGIICISDCSGNLVLCNPAIKEIKILPESCLPRNWRYCNVGIGYDPKSEDYKVHRIASYGGDVFVEALEMFPPRVEIYTLSTDSWHEIKNSSLETETTYFWPAYFQMYFKGICYWMGYEQPKQFASPYDPLEDDEKKQMIILFDTVDEVFHNILFPDSLSMFEGSPNCFDMCCDMRIILWNEFVALFGYERFGALPETYGLWVLDDFGGTKGSWTQRLSFEPLVVGIKRVLEFWKSDEILMVTSNGDIVSYNFESDKLKNLPMNIPSSFQTIVFVNSLVPVTGATTLRL